MDGLLQSPRRLPPTGRGQEDSAWLSSSQSPGRSYKEAFPGLNPLLLWGWRGSDSFLPQAHPCARGPDLAQRGNSKPSATVTRQPFPRTLFVLNHGVLETQS